MGNHKCVCDTEFCREDGGHATIRMPNDAEKRARWCHALFGRSDLPRPVRDARVSAAHFPPGSLEADNTFNSVDGSTVGVRVKDGALPTQSSDEMFSASRGALARSRKSDALVTRYRAALLDDNEKSRRLNDEARKLRLRISVLEAELKEAKQNEESAKEAAGTAPGVVGIDHNLLRALQPVGVRSLVGLSDHESLEKLYEFLDAEGQAENMVFYDQREGGGITAEGKRVEQRRKIFRGVNGLFFTLMVLRTATPIVVASALFGVHETTGGRAFTTWLNFLWRSLRPLVRLPTLAEVDEFVPQNFVDHGYAKCVLVLDATELEICRSWQTDWNWITYSTYKGRQTAKLLVAVTPGGAICYIGPAYPGRMSDVEVVKASGLVDAMVDNGLGDQGLIVMADKGFNSVSPLLIEEGFLYVAPPYKRQKEKQFTQADMESNWEVANLRIHVERAIGAMKKWSIVDKKFNHKQLDHLEMCFHVVAALVNMMQQPFKSDR